MSKNYGLPIPSDQLMIPKGFDSSDTKTSLTSKIDSHVLAWEKDVQIALYQTDSARMPSQFLEEEGWLLQAGILPSDSDRTKRQKIAGAQLAHSRRGTWQYDVEPKIFSVTGIAPVLFLGWEWDWWIRSGGNPYPPTAYWSIRGGNNDSMSTGMIRYGNGNENILGTVIFIDLGSSTLTADQISAIITALTNTQNGLESMPAYFRVYLGYTTGQVFTEYAGGQIN